MTIKKKNPNRTFFLQFFSSLWRLCHFLLLLYSSITTHLFGITFIFINMNMNEKYWNYRIVLYFWWLSIFPTKRGKKRCAHSDQKNSNKIHWIFLCIKFQFLQNHRARTVCLLHWTHKHFFLDVMHKHTRTHAHEWRKKKCTTSNIGKQPSVRCN